MQAKLNRRHFLGAAAAAAPLMLGPSAASAAGCVSPEKWDREVDVVVVGCGGAGLMAALQAHDGGASVAVFDKGLSPFHTSTRMCGGVFSACCTRAQKAQGIKDSPEEFARNIINYGAGMSLVEPVETFARNCAAAYDWMIDHGLPEGDWAPYNGHTIPRSVHQKTGGGRDYIATLVKNCEQRGIKIEHDHALMRVFLDAAENRVTGVECGNNRSSVRVKARKGVVIATGGLTGAPEEVIKWAPALDGAVTIGCGSNTGEAMRIVTRDTGAPLTHMQYYAEYPYALAVGPGRGPLVHHYYFISEGAMLVNKAGERFVNEQLPSTQITPSMKKNEGHCMYLLMTDRQFEAAAAKTPFGALVGSPAWNRERWDEELARGKVIASGRTLAEVAGKFGIDAGQLEKTVAEWNGMVAAGKDTAYGRTKFSGPLEGSVYIIAKINIWICLSLGGLRVTRRMQVKGWDDAPIKGLFAAGETVGGVHGAHYLGGDAIGFAHTSGYVAGRVITGQPVVL